MATALGLDNGSRRWFILERWQEYEGEGRANLLRVLALVGYYAIHLIDYFYFSPRDAATVAFHQQATLLCTAWLFLSLAVLLCLQRQFFPSALKYFSTLGDIGLITLLALAGNGPASPLVYVYFVVLAAAGLRFNLKLVWTATLAAMLGYMILVGAKDKTWFDAEHATPVVQQATMLLSLAMSGILIGQILRRVRKIAEQFADHHS